MAYQNLEPVSRQLTIVIGLTVVGFMAFGLALSFYRNVLFEQTLAGIEAQNDALRETIRASHRELQYFESAQFKDKYAKENLGLIRPGETVLIITQKPEDTVLLTQIQEEPTEQQEAAYEEILRQMPVIEHWKLYLFERKKIEELKMGL